MEIRLNDILTDDHPWGIFFEMQKDGSLIKFFPELSLLDTKEKGHKNNFLHVLLVLKNCMAISDDIRLCYVALFHDLGKYETRKLINGEWTFHGHEIASSKMVKKLFNRYDLPLQHRDFVYRIVLYHGESRNVFSSKATDSAVRRFYKQLTDGYSVNEKDNFDLLDSYIDFIKCDTSSEKKHKIDTIHSTCDIFKKRVYALIEADKKAAWRPCVNGDDVMSLYGLKQGKLVGLITQHITNLIKSGELSDNREICLQYLRNEETNLKELK
jgi:tRNA nucleotidyltransferase/poly(A) polymerase